jgi:preprotein translocase SecE subunit
VARFARKDEFDDEMDESGFDDNIDEVEDESSDSDIVVSDSRARRKRNRGEEVTTGSAMTDKKGRPTPSARNRGDEESGIGRVPVIGGVIDDLTTYFRGVYSEMQKVTWPTRDETFNLTRIVLAVTIAFAVSLGLIDTFYTWWFREGVEDTVLFLLIGAIVAAILGGLAWFIFYRAEDRVAY